MRPAYLEAVKPGILRKILLHVRIEQARAGEDSETLQHILHRLVRECLFHYRAEVMTELEEFRNKDYEDELERQTLEHVMWALQSDRVPKHPFDRFEFVLRVIDARFTHVRGAFMEYIDECRKEMSLEGKPWPTVELTPDHELAGIDVEEEMHQILNAKIAPEPTKATKQIDVGHAPPELVKKYLDEIIDKVREMRAENINPTTTKIESTDDGNDQGTHPISDRPVQHVGSRVLRLRRDAGGPFGDGRVQTLPTQGDLRNPLP